MYRAPTMNSLLLWQTAVASRRRWSGFRDSFTPRQLSERSGDLSVAGLAFTGKMWTKIFQSALFSLRNAPTSVKGKVVDANKELEANPALINTDPFGKG